VRPTVHSPYEQPPPFVPEVALIALGGGVGSLLRYELARAVHPTSNGFPTATLVTNLVGAFLLGVLIVAVTEMWTAHPLVRPALGTGLLGGFTTFSTFAVEVRGASASVAVGYVAATLLGGLAAALLGIAAMRRIVPDRPIADADVVDPDLP
jgi:CrcB protein